MKNLYYLKLKIEFMLLKKYGMLLKELKHTYGENKKVSATELVKLVASNSDRIEELINAEAKTLTNVGNQFQIRHFEKDKIEITDNKHIDYLFYRMVSLIHLFLSSLES